MDIHYEYFKYVKDIENGEMEIVDQEKEVQDDKNTNFLLDNKQKQFKSLKDK